METGGWKKIDPGVPGGQRKLWSTEGGQEKVLGEKKKTVILDVK